MQTPVDRKLLRLLEPIRQLEGSALEELAAKLTVEELPAGRRLFARGQRDAWTYYLVSGQLQVEGMPPEVIVGGSERARRPLSPGVPRPSGAVALTDVTYIRINNTLLEVLAGSQSGYEVELLDPEHPAPEMRLFYEICREYMEDRLELPHLPDLALRVRQAVESEQADAAAVARIIQADPVLAAKLIQVANSPLYGVQTPIYNLRSAVMLLGLSAVRNLVLTYTLKQLFRTDSPLLKEAMRELWVHGALVSAIALLIGRATAGIDADRAALMGLLHDIGKLPVISAAARYPELARDPQALAIALAKLRAPVGAMLLRRWKFGDEMVAVAVDADECARDLDPHPDYIDVIVTAQRVESGAGLAGIPAVGKVMRGQLLMDPERAPQLAEKARADVADLLSLMG